MDSSTGDMAKPEEWGRYPLMTTMPLSLPPPGRSCIPVYRERAALAEPHEYNPSTGQAKGRRLVFDEHFVQPPVKTDNVIPRWGGGEDELAVGHGGR